MKKVLINILIIFAIVAACDIAVGFLGNKILMGTPEVGTLQADAYQAMFKKKADVLILGSSRARHTFQPKMIADSTGLTAYNAGYDGHGMNYALIVLQSFLERCKPQVVVLEACAAMVTDEWLNNSIDDVKHFYGLNAPLTNYVKEYGSWQLQAKLNSNLYRLNSMPTWLVKARTIPSRECDGYEPQYGNLADTAIINFTDFETNDIQVKCFEQIIETCKKHNIKLIVYIAPSLEVTAKFQKWMNDFCAKRDVILKDHGCDPYFFSNRHYYFNDSDHLNDIGAREMTNISIGDIKVLVKQSALGVAQEIP